MKPLIAPLVSASLTLGGVLHLGLTAPASASLALSPEAVARPGSWVTLAESPAALANAAQEAPRTQDLRSLELRSPVLAVGIGLGAPWVVSTLGAGVMLLGGYPSNPYSPLSLTGTALALASPLALGAGHAYGGDPARGLGVGLGTYGAMAAGALVGLGVVAAMSPQTLASGGQSAGLAYALIVLPIATVTTLGYMIWALVDAYRSTERQNEAKAAPQP